MNGCTIVGLILQFFAAIFLVVGTIKSRAKNTDKVIEQINESQSEINKNQNKSTKRITDAVNSSNKETNHNLVKIESGIEQVNQNFTEDKKHETFEIVDYSNDYDSFKLSLLNNTNNAQYLKEINLIIKERHFLNYEHSYQNIRLHDNEVIPIYIHPTKKLYKHKPNFFIPPKEAENLNFKLYTDDEHFKFEFVEIDFQIINQNDNIISTGPIIHFIGQINASPKELSSAFQRDIEIDAPVVNKIKQSSLNKSQRTKQFLELYDSLIKNN